MIFSIWICFSLMSLLYVNTDGWINNENRYYYISDDKLNWENARASCQGLEADLLSIADSNEQEFIDSIRQNTGYSIGLKTDKYEGNQRKDWFWVDNTTYDVSVWHNWEDGEPGETGAKMCGRLFSDGKWRSMECDSGTSSYYYICTKTDPCFGDVNQCVHGECNAVHNDTLYYCECYSGYTGRNCETDINGCNPNPCQHGGKCVDAVNNYTCDCSGTGYEGYNCTTDIGECKSNPCINEGTCIDGNNNYTCDCTGTGFEGRNCETDMNECEHGDLECFYNSTCVNTPGSSHCDCTYGTTGYKCETVINECGSYPCVNGTCTDFLNGYGCNCYPGFEGTNCEKDINECETEQLICYFKSTCINIPGSAYCDCTTGTTGIFCETDIDECVSYPCVNGNCTDGLGEFICDCSAGYEGIVCDTEFDVCSTNPCVYGECKGQIYGFSCECNPGYDGNKCDADINECSHYLMQYTCIHGICENSNGSYTCTCYEGYSGHNCAESINAGLIALIVLNGIAVAVIVIIVVYFHLRSIPQTPNANTINPSLNTTKEAHNYVNIAEVESTNDEHQRIDNNYLQYEELQSERNVSNNTEHQYEAIQMNLHQR